MPAGTLDGASPSAKVASFGARVPVPGSERVADEQLRDDVRRQCYNKNYRYGNPDHPQPVRKWKTLLFTLQPKSSGTTTPWATTAPDE
jgi:hypothetical protein